MKRLAMLALLAAGCMEEKLGPGAATPLPRTALPPTVGPPVKPKLPEPVVVVEPEPTEPTGLTRANVGDTVEFSWSRVGETKVNTGAAAAMMAAASGGAPPDMEKMQRLSVPTPTVDTGTLSIVRVLPQTPFTFRVEIKSGKETQASFFSYAKEIAPHKVLFKTDPADPKVQHEAAGTTWDCVQTPTRLIAAEPASLALSGGLVSQTSPETSVGAVSVELTRVGTSKATAEGTFVKVLDTFEAPISIAMQKVQKFGIPDPEAKAQRDAELQPLLASAAKPCLTPDLQPADGVLTVVSSAGKLDALEWEGAPPPGKFDKCLRARLKKVKLPQEKSSLNVPLNATGEAN